MQNDVLRTSCRCLPPLPSPSLSILCNSRAEPALSSGSASRPVLRPICEALRRMGDLAPQLLELERRGTPAAACARKNKKQQEKDN